MADAVNHPTHYNSHPVCEAIDVCEWLSFNLGNAVKYLWRAGQKEDANQDLKKAAWYLRAEYHRTLKSDERCAEQIRALAKILVRTPQTTVPLRTMFAAIGEGLSSNKISELVYNGLGIPVPSIQKAQEQI